MTDSGAGEPSTTSINLVINNTATAAAIKIAQDQGFFEAEGLDVTVSTSTGTISSVLATLGHQNDIVFASPTDLITARVGGVNVVLINSGAINTTDNSLASFLVRQGSDIESYADLTGKTVGSLSVTSGIHYALLNILKENGVDPSTIKWVTASPPQMPDLLKAGRLDAAEEVKPFGEVAIADGATNLGDPFLQAVADEVAQVIYVAEESWANDNEDVVLRFGKAMADAGKWADDNPDGARQAIGDLTGMPEDLLSKTPIPIWKFETTPQEIASVHTPRLQRWLEVMDAAEADTGTVTPADLLPSWATE